MRSFGLVHSTFWHSPTIRPLSDDAKLLALYLMTNERNNIAGVFRCPIGYVAEDLRWGSERVSEGFEELLRNGFVNRCGTTDWVWITMHLKWNPLENPNQVKAARKLAKGIPHESVWRARFIKACGHILGFCTDESTEPFRKGSETVPESGTGTGTGERTGTGTGEPAHVPENEAAGELAPPPVADAPAPGEQRGTRLPKDWALSSEFREWAVATMPRWGDDTVEHVAERFRDFWVSKTGRDATKLDWFATWRNWCKAEKVPPALLLPEKSGSTDAMREAARKKLFGVKSAGGEMIDA